MRSALRPRRASATARLMAVVVFPTPPFWLTIARTLPTLLLGLFGYRFAAAKRLERRFGVTHPALRLEARWRFGEEGLEMLLRAGAIAPLEELEREPIVRAGEVWGDLQRVPIASDRLFGTIRLRERD